MDFTAFNRMKYILFSSYLNAYLPLHMNLQQIYIPHQNSFNPDATEFQTILDKQVLKQHHIPSTSTSNIYKELALTLDGET